MVSVLVPRSGAFRITADNWDFFFINLEWLQRYLHAVLKATVNPDSRGNAKGKKKKFQGVT